MAIRITRAPILNRGYRGSAGSSEAVQDLFHRLTRLYQIALRKLSSVASETVFELQHRERESARALEPRDATAGAGIRSQPVRERERERALLTVDDVMARYA